MNKKTIYLLISLFTIIAGFTFYSFAAPGKFEKELIKETGAIKLLKEVQRGAYGIISTSELKGMIDTKKDIIIIDTMPYEASYKKAHIPGAAQFLFPIPEMNEWNEKETAEKSIEDFKKLLGDDKDKTIVVYCGFVKCTRSHNGAMWATKLGYKNVLRHSGGIFAWKGADYPVSSVK